MRVVGRLREGLDAHGGGLSYGVELGMGIGLGPGPGPGLGLGLGIGLGLGLTAAARSPQDSRRASSAA